MGNYDELKGHDPAAEEAADGAVEPKKDPPVEKESESASKPPPKSGS